MKKWRGVLSFLLVCCMVISLLPVSAMAALVAGDGNSNFEVVRMSEAGGEDGVDETPTDEETTPVDPAGEESTGEEPTNEEEAKSGDVTDPENEDSAANGDEGSEGADPEEEAELQNSEDPANENEQESAGEEPENAGDTDPAYTVTVENVIVAVGEETELTAVTTIAPKPEVIYTAKYSSEDSDIVEVSTGGTVEGLAEGTATVQVEVTIGDVTYTAECTVTVTAGDDVSYSSTERPDDVSLDDLMEPKEVPAVMSARSNSKTSLLLIQTSNPWSSAANKVVLNQLISQGYLGAYETVTMARAASLDFSDYDVVMLANDQTADSYGQYEQIRVALEEYVYFGGVALIGACDNGWANGELDSSLPVGVVKYKDMSNYDYIADSSNPFVTGALTGGDALTNSMLQSHYCSHASFNEDTLPAGSTVILRSKNTNDPTLVEYPYGSGNVILSGVTWEHGYQYYGSSNYTPSIGLFARNSYDDLIVYALSLSGNYEEEEEEVSVYEFNYNTDKSYKDLAEMTSLFSLLAYRESVKNGSYYIISGSASKTKQTSASKAELGKLLTSSDYGFEDLYSYNYDKVGKSCGGIVSKAYNPSDDSILYTIGHRRVSINGSIQDQIVVIFRGTSNTEWFGNFNLTGTSYDSDTIHRSFLKATNSALDSLYAYVKEFSDELDAEDGLSVLTTGHSRGAAVANLFAHKLNLITDMSGKRVKTVYAYTYATPNVATYSEIKKVEEEPNIFNYCFTDDFVPNLPLETWSWGKYGKTYWATAAKLDEKVAVEKHLGPIDYEVKESSLFTQEAADYFGKSANYNTKYTNKITQNAGELAGSVLDYYDSMHVYKTSGHLWNKTPCFKTLYDFMYNGIGAVMQKQYEDSGIALIASCMFDDFATLARNFAVGGVFNRVLNYTHQCGSYYVAMNTDFKNFEYSKLDILGYDKTKYSVESGSDAAAYASVERYADANLNETEKAALQKFLNYSFFYTDEESGETATVTNAQMLGWTANDPTTWTGVTSNGGYVTAIDMQAARLSGELDLSNFTHLVTLDVDYNYLTKLNLSGCSALTSVECSGNQLTELDLTGCTSLTYLDCEDNELKSLDISACSKLETLYCSYNYLNLSDGKLLSALDGHISNGIENQKVPADAKFSTNDLEKLTAISNSDRNNSILGWDLDDPSSWSGITWIAASDGTYYLYAVDLTGLDLSGAADFSDCKCLQSLLITDNDFTSLDISGCDYLDTVWCAYNYLSESDLNAVNVENECLTPQKLSNEYKLSASDVSALTDFIQENGLGWETSEDELRSNEALTWTLSGGEYVLTGIDLSYTGISGSVDLTDLKNLKTVEAEDTAISAITLPESVTSLGSGAFKNCKSLRTVTFSGPAPTISSDAFEGCSNKLKLVLLFDVQNLYLSSGDKHNLVTSNFPAGSSISWNSSNPTVATVDNYGMVTAVSAVDGSTALITAETVNNGWTFTAICRVTIVDEGVGYIIQLDTNGGTLNVTYVRTDADGNLTYLPTPSYSGHTFNGWYISVSGGTKITVPYTFRGNTTLHAQWTATGGGGSGGGSGNSGGSISSGTVSSSYNISVESTTGGTIGLSTIRAEKGDTVTVSINPKEGYKLSELNVTDSSGNSVAVEKVNDRKYTFVMPNGKVVVSPKFVLDGSSGETSDETLRSGFEDVPDTSAFSYAVAWAVDKGIAEGYDNGTFGPRITCTNNHILTFLWRSQGSPDTEGESDFEKALAWAVENEVADADVDGNASCTRADAVTYMWRLAGSPETDGASFLDVDADAEYADAVAWALFNNITTGVTPDYFEPDTICNRGQIVTFLYRAYA